MPELPDIAILTDAFQAALAGRTIVASEAPQTLVVRGTPAELAALSGQVLQSVTRRGKFIVLQLDRDRIIVNAMLTGRLGLGRAGFEGAGLDRLGPALRQPQRAARVSRRPGRPARRGCPPDGDAIELRYRDPTRMGKVYLVPPGRDAGRRRLGRARAGRR